MKIQNILLTLAWFAIAITWIIVVGLNRENEGWEWFFRMPIGIGLLLLGIFIAPLKGIINEGFRKNVGNVLTLFLTGTVAGYLASLTIAAVSSGRMGMALVFGLFLFGIISAFIRVWEMTIGARQKLETIVTWCFQEFTAQKPWVMEKAQPGCFEGYHPKRTVIEKDIYAGKINKMVIHKISDEALLELTAIEEKELEIINLFLYVPRLPGISMDVARQIHQDGLYSPMAIGTLSLDEWQRYKGIGVKKGENILKYLASQKTKILSPP